MMTRLAYAATLLVVLCLLWVTLSGTESDPILLGFAVFGVAFALVIAWRGGYLDREGVPYPRIGQALLFWVWLIPEIFKSAGDVARRTLQVDIRLSPALLKHRTRGASAVARTSFANAITLTPGTITIETEADHFLVHALVEDTSGDNGLKEMERRAVTALDGKPAPGIEGGAP
jgi:multicomponent Na+:H+ antiporter subunit E